MAPSGVLMDSIKTTANTALLRAELSRYPETYGPPIETATVVLNTTSGQNTCIIYPVYGYNYGHNIG
jgi:hypothetical protein